MNRGLTESTRFAWPDGKRAAVSLTFDDARPSQVSIGLPILNQHDVRAGFYLNLSNVGPNVEDWRKALAQGHEIGNHTLSHPCSGNYLWSRANALEDYSMERMARELNTANSAIAGMLRTTPTTFAYPCGQKVIGRGRHAQSYVPLVAALFNVGRGFRDEVCNDPFFCDLAQANAFDADDQPLIRLKEWIDEAAERGGWSILVAHNVGDSAPRAMNAEVLDALCRYVKNPANGLWIDTVNVIGSYIRRMRVDAHASSRQKLWRSLFSKIQIV